MEYRENAGYIITDSCHVGDSEIVLGVHLTVPQQFVTWKCTGRTEYDWGHYFSDLFSVQRDLVARAQEEIRCLEEQQRNTIMIKEPTYSPWGEIQTGKALCPGAYSISTASHGGIMVYRKLAEKVFRKEARECGSISELIASNQFLSEEDKFAIPEYEKHELARSIVTFFSGVPQERPRPFPYGFDFLDAVKLTEPQLDAPARVEEIYQMMCPVWEATLQDDRNYTWRKEGFERIAAYREGTFTLFNEYKEPRPMPPATVPDKLQTEEKPEVSYLGLAQEFLRIYQEFEPYGYRDDMPPGQTDEEIVAGLAEQLRDAGQRETLIELLRPLEDAIDPEEALAIDLTLLLERLEELSKELTPEQAQRDEVAGYLEKAGWVTTDDLLETGIAEYWAHGGRGSSEDIADFIEREFLTEEEEPAFIQDQPKTYELGYGFMGNGLTVWNRLKEVDGDFETVAHIAPDRTVRIYDEAMPSEVRDEIQRIADTSEMTISATQDALVFNTPPKDEALLEKAKELIDGFCLEEYGEAGDYGDLTKVGLPPPTKRHRRDRVVFTTLHPEVPKEQRRDFHITDDALGHGTPGEKFSANVRAIRCLKKVESENRLATPEEQEILSHYVGWGGLADCFDERHSKYQELKSLLDEEEYAAARESTLTAFYTPPVVIHGIYQALSHMGFQDGNILEPSCGTGNFIGMLPSEMAGSKLYGVELDSISGRIAQQLYQNASVSINGFERMEMPDSFFDVAVGNVPFGDFKVVDRRYDKHHWLRDCVRRLIDYQTDGFPDEDIYREQAQLNKLYDSFTAQYGLINSRANKLAFSEDSGYYLLCSLEVLNKDGSLKEKAAMFSRRTIRPHEPVTKVDTASEALAVSISEKACVDMEYMSALSGKSPEEIETELLGVVFRNIEGPENPNELLGTSLSLQAFSPVTADEYLSGNVRRKLRMAKAFLEAVPDNQKAAARVQVEALEAVQPVDLTAGEIGVRISSSWVAEKGDHYYRQRQCEVCGSIYWPTHSQQKFCSEKCKKINHNKKTLEFYHKKQKEKTQCKDLSQMKEPVSSTNSSEITTIPA